VTTAGGVAAGLSHALRANTMSPAETAIEYFIKISFFNV
jgi:hypothetical protein